MAEFVVVDEGAAGVPTMIAGLLAAAIEDPAKARILDVMRGTVTIVVPDAGVDVGLRFADGVCRVHGAPIPGSTVRIEMPADQLMAFSTTPLVFGLPSPLAPAGRDLVRQVLR